MLTCIIYTLIEGTTVVKLCVPDFKEYYDLYFETEST